MNPLLPHLARSSIVKGTAIFLAVYSGLNFCWGVGFMVLGRFAGSTDPAWWLANIPNAPDVSEVAGEWNLLGNFALVTGIIALISMPLFVAVAWGLWNRKAWARIGTILALGLVFGFSVFSLTFGFDVQNLLWFIISGFGFYLYWTDEGLKRELSK